MSSPPQGPPPGYHPIWGYDGPPPGQSAPADGPPSRGGAPWWLVIVLGVAVVGLLAGLLVALLTGGSGPDSSSVRLPDEVEGLSIASGSDEEIDRPATRRAILDATGAGADAATYEDDGDEAIVYVIRAGGIPTFNGVSKNEDSDRIEITEHGEVRCNVQKGEDGDDDRAYGCDRTGDGLSVQVSSGDLSEDDMVDVVDALWEEFS